MTFIRKIRVVDLINVEQGIDTYKGGGYVNDAIQYLIKREKRIEEESGISIEEDGVSSFYINKKDFVIAPNSPMVFPGGGIGFSRVLKIIGIDKAYTYFFDKYSSNIKGFIAKGIQFLDSDVDSYSANWAAGKILPFTREAGRIATHVGAYKLEKGILNGKINRNCSAKVPEKVIKEPFKFTGTAAKHMNNPKRRIPLHSLEEIIKSPMHIAKDPQGTKALMHYSRIYKNEKLYNVEVLYDKITKQILHFKYDTRALGPLDKIQ